MQGFTQGPGVPSCTSREGRGVRGGAGGARLTWLWAGHCGHPAGGQGHSARPHCSHSRREPGPGRARGEGWLGGKPTAWSPRPSPPQHTSSSLYCTRHGLRLFCPFQTPHCRFSCFCVDFPFFNRRLKTQLLLGPSQTLTELGAQSAHFPSRSVPVNMH